ncbi:MAG TPA: fumarylacetoacetate hydrolase family protein [Ktedonobacteraceae bacterium]|jgi:2-keto-4-pentenoate hydratase|nr:fumarylacetoacetate hydrolase family protein [Ktedonobacteraceae bacterium]HLI69897.1 fumarylacetoacetate hydrolase family protein [Ktedonobacteraceae bacterium]
MQQSIEGIALALDRAEKQRQPFAPLSETYPSLTVAQAYAIQSAWLDIKCRGQVAMLIGHKIGLTSAAMQQLLGIDQPDYGFLLDNMVVLSGGILARGDFIAPRIEPEIAFWLAQDLQGPGITVEAVLAATRGVCAALELVDSRINDWRIKLVDTIADNASSARVIVSEYVIPPGEIDLAAEGVTLYCDGTALGSGTGAAVLDHPANAVAWLANKLAEFGVGLRAGQLVLPGAMCAAANVSAGEIYRASFTHLGEVAVRFV